MDCIPPPLSKIDNSDFKLDAPHIGNLDPPLNYLI